MTQNTQADTGEADGGTATGTAREEFLNSMIGALCDTIEDVVGVDDAGSFIGIVGRRMAGCACNRDEGAETADPAEVAQRLADLKNGIGGAFAVDEVEGSKITLTNSRCPFRAESHGRPSICMMTTNFFGRVAADATGYARVDVKEALSRGDTRCVITVDLERNGEGDGQEFYG